MKKKTEVKAQRGDTDQHKIWCDEKDGFQYVKACESNCKQRQRCKALKEYREPRLY